jgi:hypothetical protein
MQSPACVVAHGHTSNDKASQLPGTAPASTQDAKRLDD